MNVYDCTQDSAFFDECAEDAWGELQRGLIDRNYPGPCMMQCAPPAARERAANEQVQRQQRAQEAVEQNQDWYKAREYERQCALAQAAQRSWSTSYDPMLVAQHYGYTTMPGFPGYPSVGGPGGPNPTVPVPPQKENLKKHNNPNDAEIAFETADTSTDTDLSLWSILNSNVGLLLIIIIIALVLALYDQSQQLATMRRIVPMGAPVVVPAPPPV